MDASLRQLLFEQRQQLEKNPHGVMPTQSYLNKTSPLAVARRRPSSTQARFVELGELDNEASLLRPTSVPPAATSPSKPLQAPPVIISASEPPTEAPFQSAPSARGALHEALERALEQLERADFIPSRCQELLSRIAAFRSVPSPGRGGAGRSRRSSVASSSALEPKHSVGAAAARGKDELNARMRLLFGKLKVISRAPEVYRDMVQSKEAIEVLYRHAVECSELALNTSNFHQCVAELLQEAAGAASCVIAHSAGAEKRAEDDDAESQQFAESHGSMVTFAEESEEGCEAEVTMPLRAGVRSFGRVILQYNAEHPFPAKRSARDRLISLVEGLTTVTALSMANNESFSEASANRERAEAMLTMAKQLAMDNLDEEVLVRAIMNSARDLTGSERCRLFLVQGSLLTAYVEDGSKVTVDVYTGAEGEVARTGAIVNMIDAATDPRFNPHIDRVTGTNTRTMLCLPVQYEGAIVAVAQLINKQPPLDASATSMSAVAFTARDVELFMTFATFVGVSLRNCRLYQKLHEEKRKSETILSVVQQLSNSDIRDVQSVVKHVMKGAKTLLNADRATLFLVDKERNELHSTIADSTAGKEIRIPIGVGIAGTVAELRQGENITDAYADPRFNRAVDISMGYTTRSMLTEPIIFQDEVLAVAQLVNKIDSHGDVSVFTAEDKETFKAFSLFAGISISNSHLLEFAINAGREAMNLHNISQGVRRVTVRPSNDISDQLLGEIMALEVPEEIDQMIMSRDFNLFEVRERYDELGKDYAAKILAEIILRTGLPARFGCPPETLFRFVLACRAKYRKVPYHNFFHAVDVAQTIQTFINEGGAKELLSELQCFVLMITAIVHDLDHMGLNNSFHLKTDSPLGMLSSASGNNSVLEVHHCNLAIGILEDPAKNVFIGLSPDDSREAFKLMIECVLATDMARHKDLCSQFEALSGGHPLRVSNDDDAKLLMQMLTKAADISNVTKPFEVSRLWGLSVTEEFYQQGDKERAKGVDVLPMFDRTKNNELANGQLGFINFIAKPFFTAIATALPKLSWCTDNIRSNTATWEKTLLRRHSTLGSTSSASD